MEVDENSDESDDISSIRNIMLDHISSNNEAHFKSQQLNEPDLTVSEKHHIAETLLEQNPGNFLSRFGKYLKQEHLPYFSQLAKDNYEVNFYINELKQNFHKVNKSTVRNRRLEALRRLTNESEYFSDDEMRRRNPLMYEHLVGQYLTMEEKKNILAERIESKSFTDIILNTIDEKEVQDRLKSETEKESTDEDFSDNDYDMDSEDSFEEEQRKLGGWGEFPSSNNHSSKPKRSKSLKKFKKTQDLSEQEKTLLMNEFRSHMYSEFLVGKDEEFDYSKVDANNDYDDLDMLEIDQQDKYFDSETPEVLSKGEESSDSSCFDSLPPPKSLSQKMADLGK